MTEQNPPLYLEAGCYTAEDDRNLTRALVCAEGVHDKRGGNMAPTQTSPPSMAVRVGSGSAFIQGDTTTFQGMYYALNAGQTIVPIGSAADPTDNRYDLIVARVYDDQYDGSGRNEWVLEWVEGMPSPVPAPPATPPSSVVVAQVLVRAGATTIINSDLSTALTPQAELCRTLMPPLRTFVQKFTPGTYTITPPSDWQTVRVRLWGAGGGSGSVAATPAGYQAEGGPGGGGAYSETVIDFTDNILTGTPTLVVGSGGAAGIGPTGNGGTGGSTSFLGYTAGGGGFGFAGVARNSTGITGSGGGGQATGGADIELRGSDAMYGRVDSGIAMRMSHGAPGALGSGARMPTGAGAGGAGLQGYTPGGGASPAINSVSQPARDGGLGGEGMAVLEWTY